jgi:hypothetical protein
MAETRTRSSCPDCRGCDTCFHAGRSHEVSLLKQQNARLWEQVQAIGLKGTNITWVEQERRMLLLRNTNAYAAKLGAKIHRLRAIARSYCEVREINAEIQRALAQASDELTPALHTYLRALDEHLNGAQRARKAAWEAEQRAGLERALVPEQAVQGG